MKPFYEVKAKLTITSDYSVDANNVAEDTFDITIVDQCYANVLSVATAPSDINYLIEADGATASTNTIAGVTGS